ncbi:rod shape-determining protein [Candidatus Daviesbacteria bacterium RIFCSPHIGHO2_01_FULL_44_29]|uniref:Cell shape-determining protein MreB n=1 Tax=Candidatus Daviesbacteria bacterium RIFCSPHIGHO2_02_FULL_43_12 TaxID=1797776 RepID=A0A1F5KIT3_9BACT|nr:MAG: rod shape-determining protein [Candidatus Daviesbacteria bacterium RIFCSPHIGHO2_01_FULL_44_29]OGE40420.1 MAG: rod shape-determining protein [Candidatus Daviesbacteria bacterium RIFCSPHIGHO2_12_FULL_47_45]OGE40730.1 MAG: rod shape-determining protein [Candidatus Daviesbacteria bacterium RIFCSPHIGHO2_02_FULL_43_12]OGE69773.1 MAG: rod shape-determining protein [Candidatus Daviesbacteria bacterium RIFCSPLOWO2_01_FULL_43_15]
MFKFSKRIGIDLGTANSLVYLAGTGIVMNEPTVVAVSTDDNRVLAVGNEAKEMLGRTPGNIQATRPMRDGVIADYVITEAMLRYFIDKVCGSTRFFKPEVMVCVPAGVTSVERRAVLDATLSAGAKTAFLIDEPLAAAIGANIPIANPSGNMIVDIGGGTAEAAVICLGGVVVHSSARVGGNKIDEAIINLVRKRFGLMIGDHQAEEVKIQIGIATLPKKNEVKEMEVRGRDASTGLPKTISINSFDVNEAISDVLKKIIGAVKGVLEQTPPELASDIIDKGIVMSGGTSQLHNLDKLMTEQTGVPCHLAENPLYCVALGTGLALENLDLYKRSVSKR